MKNLSFSIAKKFSVEEIHTLSRFNAIEISCDTCNPELFKKLRRGNNLQTLCANISRIKAMAAEKKLPLPALSFSCVVSDQNIFHLPDLVTFGKGLGIRHDSCQRRSSSLLWTYTGLYTGEAAIVIGGIQ